MTGREDSALEIVRSFMKEMEALNYDRAVQKLAADLEYVNPPPIGAVHGPNGMRAVLEPFFAPTLENEFVILREATAGETVFLERLDRHRLADRWVELPVTGVFEVRAGLIAYWRDYFDAATILSQWPS
ncbi:MAG: nuclear transport factor 2 family protein [Proteobacteria bacterium]|nr:nuclear transport factor 2 family protein [Pseudomonadota bacterium]